MDQSAGSQAAAVVKDSYPVRWAGRQAVVVLPEHIGHANAPQVGEQLLSVINRGADAPRRSAVPSTRPSPLPG